eukprot:TRINITY_DN1806_c0_g1_i1.p1 TRINITY_DN1806_c0_g1~~TRINITY_DN1806_c0_g1_i1.p1  ORF type:complete len:987 (-),score=159.87 TRINITY_DN1806_c0_g1_i1:65-3025(-)
MADTKKPTVTIRVDKERKAVIKEIDSKILIWERRATQSFVDRAYRISDDEKSDSEGSNTPRSPRSPRNNTTSSASPLARASTVKSIARQIESTAVEKTSSPITPRTAARNSVNIESSGEVKTPNGTSTNGASPDNGKKRLDSPPKSPTEIKNSATSPEIRRMTEGDRRDSEQINTNSSSSSSNNTDAENNNDLPKPNLMVSQSLNVVSASLPTTPDVDRRRLGEGERLKYQGRNQHEDCMAIERELRRLHNFSMIQNDKLKEKIGMLNANAREEKKRVLLLEDELSFVYSKLKEMGVEIPVYTPPADLQIPDNEPSASESPIKGRVKRVASTEDVSMGEDSNTEGESGKGEIKIKKRKKDKIKSWRKKKKGKDDRSAENSVEEESGAKESKSFLSKFTSALSRSRAHSVSGEGKHKKKGDGSDDGDSGAGGKSPSRTRGSDSPKVHNRATSISDPPKPVEEPDITVAYGVTRGACKPPCKCLKYNPKSHGAACACGHTSVTHLDLGRIAGYTGPADPSVVSDTKGERKASVSMTASTDTGSASDPNSPLGRTGQSGDANGAMNASTDSQAGPESTEATPKFTLEAKKNIRDTLKPEWLMEYDDLYFVEVLGKGTSSVVYKGTYKDEEVAIKVLRLETQKRDIEDFKKELEVLSFLRSEYVVNFIGAALEPKLCMVLEYCPRGSMYQYMHDVRLKFTWDLLLKWITETIRGVNCLHLWKPQIVHRDLKTPNLLIDKDYKIKVCDFGLSRIIADDQNLTTLGKLRGTYAYTAPELYHGATFTTKSDVYSIGIVLWEMVNRLLTGKHDRPFAEYKEIQHDFQVIVKAATKKLRPTIPATCPESIANLIKFCWHERQEDRPSCADLLVILEKLTNDYQANREAWDVLVPEAVPVPRFKREPSMKQGPPAIVSPKGTSQDNKPVGNPVRLSASMSSSTVSAAISSGGHQRNASAGGSQKSSIISSSGNSPRKSDPGAEITDPSQASTEVKS